MILGRTNGESSMRLQSKIVQLMVLCVVVATLAVAQAPYQPKFPGDPARSVSEAQALGYMRTVLRAQKQYNKKYGKFADSLNSLVHTGSFTKRMAATDRGDYKVGFRSKKDGFQLTMTPKELDAQHRSFYAEENEGLTPRGDV